MSKKEQPQQYTIVIPRQFVEDLTTVKLTDDQWHQVVMFLSMDEILDNQIDRSVISCVAHVIDSEKAQEVKEVKPKQELKPKSAKKTKKKK